MSMNNPHGRMVQAQKGVPFAPGSHGQVNICEGMTFAIVKDFEDAIRTYSVANGFMICQPHNEKRRYKVFCKNVTCPWKIVASAVEGRPIFKVRSFVKKHTYDRKHTNNYATSL